MRRFRFLLALPVLLALGGCNFVVLHPAGDIAWQQRDLLIVSTLLMLIIIIPVMALTVLFAWRYRQGNKTATYRPKWDHSIELELVIWGAPLLIIICLGALTWMDTHLLDPYRPLSRVAKGQPVAEKTEPLEVEVVALDWKWLFIYPQYGVASLNELAAPVDRPISFRITSSAVMNSFYIPALAGQIYAMPGMQTKLHAVINRVGAYEGFSANYSGAGFSGMRFAFHGMEPSDFDRWVGVLRNADRPLTRAAYLELEKPSENVPVQHFASVDPALFKAVLNMCVEPGKMCMSEMAAIDSRGGLGLAGIDNVIPRLAYDKFERRGAVFGPPSSYVAGICTIDELTASEPRVAEALPADLAPLLGAGLQRPGFTPARLDTTLLRSPAIPDRNS